MNPRKINIYLEGYNQKTKRDFELSNVLAHIQGMYFVEALMATVGNMFSDKKSQPFEYPKDPYQFGKNSDELSEHEIEIQRELFVAQYMTMMNNFNLSKELKEQEQGE